MTVRGVQLRVVLIPLTVAAVLVAAIMWYRLFWIPGQQQYLNERNARILRSIAVQISTKLDNFDQGLDNAMDFWWSTDGQNAKSRDGKDFSSYVRLFAPDVEAITTEGSVVKHPDDPPRVRIQREEGANYLYLGYKHESDERKGGHRDEPPIEAKINIEQVVRPYLRARKEFEALVLADHSGHTIAQYSSGGVRLEHVDHLDFSSAVPSTAQAPKPTYAMARDSGKVASVAIGEVAYKFYAHPVALSLMSDGTEAAAEEWTLCGLVRADRFGAESLAIPPDYWLMFVVALISVCLGVPILKVHVLKPRERFHWSDGTWVAATTFVLAGLITVIAFDAYYFKHWFEGQNDRQLRQVAETVATHFQDETKIALGQLEAFRADLAISADELRQTPVVELGKRGQPVCTPASVCKPSLLADREFPYPYFDQVSWTDSSGSQRVKWSTSKGITPFINLRSAKVAYFDALERANLFNQSGRMPIDVGIDVIRSPNTGNPLTVLWEALGNNQPLSGVSLASAAPLSVRRPVLPRRMRFAVIDAAGQVMFHSDPARSLNENFFDETQGNASLRVAVQGRQSAPLTTQYLGARQRLYATPLDLRSPLAAPGTAVTRDPKWSVLVFQPVEVLDTVNLETLIMTAAMFSAYCLALAAVWGVVVLCMPERAKKWFWPDHEKGAVYRTAAKVNLGLSAVFVALVAQMSPAVIVAGAIVLAASGVVTTFVLVAWREGSRASSPTWQRDFFLARLSFLFVAAAVPAMACFQAAFTLETDVLVRSGQLHLSAERDLRKDRIHREAQKLALCGSSAGPCANTTAFLQKRILDGHDIADAPFFETLTTPAAETNRMLTAGWLDRVLALTHLSINDEAVDLRAALLAGGSSESRWASVAGRRVGLETSEGVMTSRLPRIQVDARYWIIAAAAAAGLALLLGYGVMPMFLLPLCGRHGFKAPRASRAGGNRLLVGPPGAETAMRLRNDPAMWVFDAWTDTLDPAAAEVHDFVGVDHFEHGLEAATLRGPLLTFLEGLTYRRRQVWIASTREPFDQLRELSAADQDRWGAVLQSFRKEIVGLTPLAAAESFLEQPLEPRNTNNAIYRELVRDECAMSPVLLKIGADVLSESQTNGPLTAEDLLTEIGIAAEPYYHMLWATCSREEKLALQQLAAEEVVNPANGHVIERLLASGLVRRAPTFRLMNETFRRFALQMVSPADLRTWEREGVELPWISYASSIGSFAVVAAAVLFLTQQQLLDAWIGYVPALVPAATTIGKMFATGSPKAAAGNA